MNPEVGLVIGGRYELTARIAVGGMGEVWKSMDSVLGREVAVKVLKPEYSSDNTFLTRFRNEARHAAALSHPNIAGVYDYSDSGGLAYLVMELVPGEPLNQIIARMGAVPVPEAMSVLAQAARGLGAAHAAGVVHRDVKPGNLLITPSGDVKITDFGIARAGDSVPLTQTGQVMGTAQYLAPEQASGQEVTGSSDLYALGVVGYELLMGRRPFDGESPVAIAMAHVNTTAPELPESFSHATRTFIASALAKEASERPASAAEFADIADLIADGRDQEALALLPNGRSEAPTEVMPSSEAQRTRRTAMQSGAGAAAGAGSQSSLRPTVEPSQPWETSGSASTTSYQQPSNPPRKSGSGIMIFAAIIAVAAIILLIFAIMSGNGKSTDSGNVQKPDPAQTSITPTTETAEPTDSETTPEETDDATTDAKTTTKAPTTTKTKPTTTTTKPTTTTTKPAETTTTPGNLVVVEVIEKDLKGLPYKDVKKALIDSGLKVKTVPQQTATHTVGSVLSVTPSGPRVPVGTTVTLTYAVAPTTTPTSGETTTAPVTTQPGDNTTPNPTDGEPTDEPGVGGQ